MAGTVVVVQVPEEQTVFVVVVALFSQTDVYRLAADTFPLGPVVALMVVALAAALAALVA